MAAVITEAYYRDSVSLDPSLRMTGEMGGDPSKSSTAWYGILDSGAMCSILTGDAIDLFDGGSLRALTSMTVNTASRGGSLRINAMGSIGRFPEVYYAVADLLLAQGYQVEFKTGGCHHHTRRRPFYRMCTFGRQGSLVGAAIPIVSPLLKYQCHVYE
jgi:hypothetical protein